MDTYDWKDALISRKGKSKRNRDVVFCKLGRHNVDLGVPLVWLKNPLGQSCEPCARENGWTPPPPPPAGEIPPPPPPAAKVPAPRRTRRSPDTRRKREDRVIRDNGGTRERRARFYPALHEGEKHTRYVLHRAPLGPKPPPPVRVPKDTKPKRVPARRLVPRSAQVPRWVDVPAPCMAPHPIGPKLPGRHGPIPRVPSDWEHGRRSTYVQHGCRCTPCRKADSTERSALARARRARAKVPA